MEQELVTREEVKKALRYPIMVVIAIAAAFIFLTVFIVPRFAGFYTQHGAELPLPTQVMISVSDMVRNSWYVLLPAVAILLVVVGRALKLNRLRRTVDSLLLKLPVFGDLFVKTSLSRFAHLLAVLVASGTPLIQSLGIVRDAVGNVIIGDEVGRFAEGLKEGRSIDDTRHQMRHFPKLAISLVHVGMESGTLDLTLKEISRFFDREVHYSSSRLTSALEPILIIVMGAMVLVLALGIFLPMWNLIQVFR
jgi:MSHA biogenesis protein MshG